MVSTTALRGSELAEAQRLAHVGSWTLDPATGVLAWSDELYRIFGHEPGGPIPSFGEAASGYDAVTLARRNAIVARTLATGEPFDTEYDITRPDGSTRHVAARGEVVRDASGAVTGLRGTVADVTVVREAEAGRLRTEAALAASEHELRLVLENTADVLIRYAPDGTVLWASPSLRTVFGWDPDAVVGTSFRLSVAGVPDVPSLALGEAIAAHRDGVRARIEAMSADGSTRPVDVQVRLVWADDGALAFSVAAFRDVTEQARAEEALRESEASYRSLFTHMQEGLAHCRIERAEGRPVDWTYLAVNEAFKEQTGLRDAAGRRVSDLIPGIAESDPELLEIYGRVAAGGGPERFETRVAALDAWFDISVYSPSEDEFVAIFDVITERKRAEETLRAAAARDALLVDSSIDGIFRVALPRGRFLDANPAACAIFGCTHEELLDADLLDLTDTMAPGDDPATALTVPPEALAGGTSTIERVVVRGDGSRATLSARLRLLPDGTILVNARDRTRERVLEQQFEQAQRMEVVGRLAGGIAHDFNNLLMAINGYAGLILEALPPQDPLRPDVAAIREAGERGAVLTRQLLAFSRRQTLQPAEVVVGVVVAGLRPILTRLIGEDVTLFVRSDPQVSAVFADPAQLEQVVINLVTNARDAMPEGGALAIETTEVEIAADDRRLRPAAVAGRYVRLAVTDTGTGMDEATIGHVLEPFYTTKPIGQGTGLGLSTVEGIVAQSGGFISIESTVGRGTTVDVFLPRVEGTAAGRETLSRRVAAMLPGGTEGVLLVEDEPAVRAVAGRMLRELGYEVFEATGPTQALAIAADHPDDLDLVITDVVMPEMNGRVLAERLVSQRPGVAVLFMSGYSPESVFRQGYLLEGAAYLRKPFTRADIATAVRAALDGRSRPDGQLSGSVVRR